MIGDTVRLSTLARKRSRYIRNTMQIDHRIRSKHRHPSSCTVCKHNDYAGCGCMSVCRISAYLYMFNMSVSSCQYTWRDRSIHKFPWHVLLTSITLHSYKVLVSINFFNTAISGNCYRDTQDLQSNISDNNTDCCRWKPNMTKPLLKEQWLLFPFAVWADISSQYVVNLAP